MAIAGSHRRTGDNESESGNSTNVSKDEEDESECESHTETEWETKSVEFESTDSDSEEEEDSCEADSPTPGDQSEASQMWHLWLGHALNQTELKRHVKNGTLTKVAHNPNRCEVCERKI